MLTRAAPCTFDHAAVLSLLVARWESREGAPATSSAGPWLLSDLCREAGCAMPAPIKAATDALGEALGAHHVLRAQPITDATPIPMGGSGVLSPIDARLWIIDIGALTPAELARLGIG